MIKPSQWDYLYRVRSYKMNEEVRYKVEYRFESYSFFNLIRTYKSDWYEDMPFQKNYFETECAALGYARLRKQKRYAEKEKELKDYKDYLIFTEQNPPKLL